ncbi:lytic transglycosylase domain-containing protein [Persicobacter psychrovividus]
MKKTIGLVSLMLALTATVKAEHTDNNKVTPDHEVSMPMVSPDYDYEYIPDPGYKVVGERMALLDAEQRIPMHYNEKVKNFIDYFTLRNRGYTKEIIRKSHMYFPIFEKTLAQYNLPDELKYLSIVESGLRPAARSHAGAMGLWQFMYFTGREYGLQRTSYYDDRVNPVKATEAACKMFTSLYSQFNDWELALAAYNCGPGNVRKAIRRSGKKTFWGIYNYLPRETRSYVPQFAAVVYTMKYAEEHNLYVDDPAYLPDFREVLVSQFTNLKVLANQLEICPEDLRKLNPSLKHDAIPPFAKSYPLILPVEAAERFTADAEILLDSATYGQKEIDMIARNIPGSVYGRERIRHRVRSGDVLGKIARRYGVRVSDVREWNNIRGNMIRVGQRLDIWVKPSYFDHQAKKYNRQHSAKKTSSSKRSTAKSKPISGKIYVVKSGDSLWSICKEIDGLTVSQLKKWNGLRSNHLKVGQKLKVG